MSSYGETKRANAARSDLPKLIGSGTPVGLVLLDDDLREEPMIEGQIMRVGPDSLIFRRDGVDEEIPLSMVSKRVHGDDVVSYGEIRRM
jgi:hypothetical protein